MTSLRLAWSAIGVDQAFLESNYDSFRRRSKFRAFATNPSLRAAFWMRLAAGGGATGHLARTALIRGYACDVSPGAVFEGAMHLPHPVGIVIGHGARIGVEVTIYQGVTVGAARGGYPTIGDRCTLYPHSIIAGPIEIGAKARVGAGVYCDRSMPALATLKRSTRERVE